MSLFTFQNPWVFTLGMLGNIVSIMVYLSPVPTFYRIFKRKSTEGFHAFPYVVSLFSAMLWIYYATLRSNMLLITINSIGCFIEAFYIALFIAFAPRKTRNSTLTLVTLLNFVGFGFIVFITQLLAKGSERARVVGWFCVSFSAIVFIAPLSILRQVIRTKSVEFMPFWLSVSLVLSAVTWFFYGLLSKDLYVAVPNVVGFIFGVLQVIMYFIYKKKSKEDTIKEQKLPTTINGTTEIYPVCSLPIPDGHVEVEDQKVQDINVESGEEKPNYDYCVQV